MQQILSLIFVSYNTRVTGGKNRASELAVTDLCQESVA